MKRMCLKYNKTCVKYNMGLMCTIKGDHGISASFSVRAHAQHRILA